MNLREKIVDPLFYRLGYLHYSNTIGGILSGDAETIGEPVDGYLVFPDDTVNDGRGIHIEFTGTAVDPDDDGDDDPDTETQCAVCSNDTATARCCGQPHDYDRDM